MEDMIALALAITVFALGLYFSIRAGARRGYTVKSVRCQRIPYRFNPATGLPMSDSTGSDDWINPATGLPMSDSTGSGGWINPATGLPMMDGFCVDVAGNPFGADLNCFDSFDSGSSFD